MIVGILASLRVSPWKRRKPLSSGLAGSSALLSSGQVCWRPQGPLFGTPIWSKSKQATLILMHFLLPNISRMLSF